jgi:5-hydroxyisourate hydrolase-like protein (transthyretin family)
MTMATTDNGQPVNHHLEVHVTSKSTGSPAANIQPQISITDDATGQTRALASVMSMYDIQVGQSDLHYGNNVYLPDGGYTVTVVVGSDMAQFSQVMVSDGMGLPPDSMGAMGDSMGMDGNPMQMPGH